MTRKDADSTAASMATPAPKATVEPGPIIDRACSEPRHREDHPRAGQEAAGAAPRRTVVGWALDGALMALGPALIVLDATIRLRTADSFMTKLEPIVVLVIGLPWISLLPIAVTMWLRRTGFRSPGQLISRSPHRARHGRAPADVFPIGLAAVACGALLYTTELTSEGVVVFVGLVVISVTMLIGTLLSLKRP